jgi:hypothetical protein
MFSSTSEEESVMRPIQKFREEASKRIIEKRKKNPNQLGFSPFVIFNFFLFLSPTEIQNCQQVSWYWNQIIQQSNLWKKEYFKLWSLESFFFQFLNKNVDESTCSVHMKEIFLIKRYYQELYTKGTLTLMKHYTESDIKIMMLPKSAFEVLSKSNEWELVDDFQQEDIEDMESNLITPIEDKTSDEISLLNFENVVVDDEGNKWIDSSFQLDQVYLKDKKVILHMNRFQSLTGKSFERRSIFDVMMYSQYSAEKIHKYSETTQWISSVESFSSEVFSSIILI